MKSNKHDILIITGATASGKTGLASQIAAMLNSEVISADSRQVYRKMDIGTGKDYSDYIVEGCTVPYHLIDIVDPGYKYNVYEYQRDFLEVYKRLSDRGIMPVVCGGSGMYIDSIVSGYRLIQVPPDPELRELLKIKSLAELQSMLASFKSLHNSSDTDNTKRAIRAIEIEEYYLKNPDIDDSFPEIKPLIVGIKYDRESRRRRISERLKSRLEVGMIEEVKMILDSGVPADDLIYYGLEYKFLTLYLTGEITYREMFSGLETSIHQFAKRQMTWFRSMEKKGIEIHWFDGYMPKDEKIEKILRLIRLED